MNDHIKNAIQEMIDARKEMYKLEYSDNVDLDKYKLAQLYECDCRDRVHRAVDDYVKVAADV